jgi:ATP-dependent helicase/nuclease subunit B
MTSRIPRLFNIPPSAPFLPTLIAALVDGRLVDGFPASRDPLALAEATLYLPTRRACRLAQDVFRQVLGTDAAILPRIVPVGDIDEDEIVFADIAAGALAQEALSLPRAMENFERKAWLTQLILAWAKSRGVKADDNASLIANSPSAAFTMAGELARLQDDMITREVPWSRLDTLVPREMDRYFEATLEFLKIARDLWPNLLNEPQMIDIAARRDRLIDAETMRLQRAGGGPVIAAGSTASMPSTAKLLSAIARLPNGAVVLPGLDTDLEDRAFDIIAGGKDHAPAPSHPQYSMHAFLRRLQVKRDTVIDLAPRGSHGREMIVSEAMRPAESTESWQARLNDLFFEAKKQNALASLTLIEAANPEEESLAIALALREAVSDGTPESEARTAALITPDRALAQRVLAALARWNVPVDDSGGDALAETQAGLFARLAAETALRGCEPVTLLALLKHPLCRFNTDEFSHLRAVSALERAILRGPRPRAGADGLMHALQTLRAKQSELHRSDPRAAISDKELDRAEALIITLKAALEPLSSLRKPTPLFEFATHHHAVLTALSATAGGPAAFAGRDGEMLESVLQAVAASGSAAQFPVAPYDYPDLFHSIASDNVVRRPGAPNARVRIYGPLEARLQQADRVVLSGLVEGVWPPEPRNDPWLNRPMRQELGLDLPERRIGLAAHDFAQALGAKEVFLTYATKREGAPAVISRFVQRLSAVSGPDHWKVVKARGEKYLDWARSLDRPATITPAQRPAPTPPREARPKRLSVTEIEHWLRDPYTIYAKHILRLNPLDAVDTPPGARDRGTVIHKAIGDFTERFAGGLPDDPYGELIALGRAAFAPLNDYPEAQAFWWPRFERIASWFVGWEIERRARVTAVHAEIDGRLQVTPDFLLTARADRIEILEDGSLAVLDYKTGQPPSSKQVRANLAPQLTLQAAMVRKGGFEKVGATNGSHISELLYLRLHGGNPGGEKHWREFENSTIDQEADKALAQLAALAIRFASDDEPYRSFSRPMWVGRSYGPYDHLARVKEWSATGGVSDESGE